MKKSWKRLLAVAVVLVLTLCVLSSCGDNTQAKIDEAVKKVTETLTKEKDDAVAAVQAVADEAVAAKTELEGKVADLTKKLEDAEAAGGGGKGTQKEGLSPQSAPPLRPDAL